MGENHYIRIGTISKELQDAAERAASDDNFEITTGQNQKNIGDKVFHPAFGKGKIVGFEKNKNSYRIKLIS